LWKKTNKPKNGKVLFKMQNHLTCDFTWKKDKLKAGEEGYCTKIHPRVHVSEEE
jgi:hypothetical protein